MRRWGLFLALATADLLAHLERSGVLHDTVCGAEGLTQEACLSRGPHCMFIDLEGVPSRCTVCEFGGNPLPCPAHDSVYSGSKVKSCTMSCSHQQILSKVSPCEDTTEDVTLSQCFAKGTSALTKCMWTQEGLTKTFCGPCSVVGVGTVPCPGGGALGMTGAPVTMCMSQCDDPCPPMLPGCDSNTAPPPPLLNGPVPIGALKIATTDDAPNYVAIKVLPPYGKKDYEDAARIAAQVAMWGPDTKQPPSVPFSIYGPPPLEGPTLPPDMPIMYGPAPPGIPGVPPPGYGFGTAPPPAMVALSGSFLQAAARPRLRAAKRS